VPGRKKRSTSWTDRINRRTRVVWASFIGMMTFVTGVLMLSNGDGPPSGYLAANVGTVGEVIAGDPLFQIQAPVDADRWDSIVIHDLGQPAGDAEMIHRVHRSYGYQGLGYHFVIGNGNGLGDGVVHVGYRWNEQLPGVHVAGPMGDYYNRHAIGICLVGNGDRRPFTEQQMNHLIRLVQRLQRELDIPSNQVFLHRDLFDGVSSPGRYFEAGRLEEQLLVGPR
jgi:hypothetical protein